MKLEYVKSLIIALLTIVVMVLVVMESCNSNENIKLQSDNETLEVVNQILAAEAKQAAKQVDTIYQEKESLAQEHAQKIEEVHKLDSAQQDSLFGLIYPSKDSANATYYHCLYARRQLILSDSIIGLKDTIIAKQGEMLCNKDTIITNQQQQLAKTESKVTRWKILATIGWLLNLTH